jgi:hypothetical protein
LVVFVPIVILALFVAFFYLEILHVLHQLWNVKDVETLPDSIRFYEQQKLEIIVELDQNSVGRHPEDEVRQKAAIQVVLSYLFQVLNRDIIFSERFEVSYEVPYDVESEVNVEENEDGSIGLVWISKSAHECVEERRDHAHQDVQVHPRDREEAFRTYYQDFQKVTIIFISCLLLIFKWIHLLCILRGGKPDVP